MRIDPWQWARWTLRDFYLAYGHWREVNVHMPWEIGRMIGFWAVAPHTNKFRKFEDLFPLSIDAIRNGKRKVSKVIVRKQTPEERKILESIINGQQLSN